jgi:hypothetical protein
MKLLTFRRDEFTVINETQSFTSRSFTVVFYSSKAGHRGMLLRYIAGERITR